MVDRDVLPGYATAGLLSHQVLRIEQVNELGCQPSGCGRFHQPLDRPGPVAGFFQQFPRGRCLQGFSAMLVFIADDASGDFDDAALDGNAELLDEHNFLLRRDGEDADTRIRVRPTDKIPVPDALKLDPAGFKKRF